MMKISTKYKLNFAILGALNAIVVAVGIYGMFLVDDVSKRPLAIGMLVAAAVIVAILVICISRMLEKSLFIPLLTVTDIATNIGDTGNFRIGKQALSKLKNCSALHDEIGDLARALDRLTYSLNIKADILEILADGDLSAEVPVDGDEDLIGVLLRKVISNLNAMTLEVRTSAEQLSIGISQLSTAAQSLATSTTQQSATVQALLASASDIAQKAEQNAKKTDEASKLSIEIKEHANDGRGAMERMTQSIEDINEAGQSIGSVMKVIDEIAFQTNILALNAAVEAARAGQHGKGFAVVADEVRNLASKSADAANSSNVLIEDTLKKTETGSQIVNDTSEYLGKILGGVDDNAQIIDEISVLTVEQGQAIDEVNRRISELTNVVYQNSATAEQSAAATDEMDTQIRHLIELVGRFMIRDEHTGAHEPTYTERIAMESNAVPPKAGDSATWVPQEAPPTPPDPQEQPVLADELEPAEMTWTDIPDEELPPVLDPEPEIFASPVEAKDMFASPFEGGGFAQPGAAKEHEGHLPDDESKY